jgi:hypothetical protein
MACQAETAHLVPVLQVLPDAGDPHRSQVRGGTAGRRDAMPSALPVALPWLDPRRARAWLGAPLLERAGSAGERRLQTPLCDADSHSCQKTQSRSGFPGRGRRMIRRRSHDETAGRRSPGPVSRTASATVRAGLRYVASSSCTAYGSTVGPHFLTLDETTFNNISPLGSGQSAGATRCSSKCNKKQNGASG